MRLFENNLLHRHYDAVRRYKALASVWKVIVIRDGSIGWMSLYLKGRVSYASWHHSTWKDAMASIPRNWGSVRGGHPGEDVLNEMDMVP